MQLDRANKIMGIFNEIRDELRQEQTKIGIKKRCDSDLHNGVYEGLTFALILLAKKHEELENLLLSDENTQIGDGIHDEKNK